MKPVFLIGYMGCGKTTLGEVLARQMGLLFIDLDEYIERKQGATIVEIFDKMGEKRFRELETAALCDVAAMSDVIVGCGGGTPCHGDNMALMNEAAFLPLVKRELEARTPYYSQARLQFDSTDIETGPATERTARRLAILLHPHLETGNEVPKTRN